MNTTRTSWPTVVAGLVIGTSVVVRPYDGGAAFIGTVTAVEYEDVTVAHSGMATTWPMYRVEVL